MKKQQPAGTTEPFSRITPFAEFVDKEVARRRAERETPGSIEAQQHEKLQRDLQKIREKKARQRARDPYRFDGAG